MNTPQSCTDKCHLVAESRAKSSFKTLTKTTLYSKYNDVIAKVSKYSAIMAKYSKYKQQQQQQNFAKLL